MSQNIAEVTCMQGKTRIVFDGTEGDLFARVGQLLRFIPAPDTIRIMVGNEYADLIVDEKGVHPFCNGIHCQKTRYEQKYLTRIDPETNQYDFYKITPYNMGARTISCGGSFGRIGADKKDLNSETIIRSPYPSYMYWIRYYEKLNQGYQDISDIMVEEDEELARMFSTEDPEEAADDFAVALYNKLREAAKDALSSQIDVNFLTESCPFTKKQVNESRKILNSLGQSKDVDDFNKKLMKLLMISPRKVDKYRGQTIDSLLAKTGNTLKEQQEIFAKIIEREESLVQAMDAVVNTVNARYSKTPVVSPFGNIEISEPTDVEKDMVISHLSDQLKPKVKQIYRVHAVDQQLKYDKYKAENGITETKLLWHGSRNENWISIIKSSLMLNPNAVITGKMWGYGIYFAPSSMKSWGYTSCGRYSGNGSKTVYMGLYETAYGTPYLPTSLMNGTQELMKQSHTNCLHAKANVCGLANDEIIFYDEAAVCIQYLVEFNEQ